MPNKFYAVKIGRSPGVYHTWAECKASIDKYKGAVFKSFGSLEEAQDFARSRIKPTPPPGLLPFEKDDRCTCVCTCGKFPGIELPIAKRSETEFIALGFPLKRKIEENDRKSKKARVIANEQLDSRHSQVIYTDGACEANGRGGAKGGIGVYWGPNHPMNVSEPLLGRQTNNRAEIMAVVRALNQCRSSGTKSVTICTDSKFLIRGITQWIHKWKTNGWKLSTGGDVINKEDFVMLDEAQQGLNVEWVHVRGHRGILGNEEADKLAKNGARKM